MENSHENVQLLSLRQVALPISKFNSALTIHVTKLRGHKRQIEKLVRQHGDPTSYDRIKKEELNAIRLIKEIRSLIVEINDLRMQINEHEREELDRKIPLKKEALSEIQAYFAMELKPPDKPPTLMDDENNSAVDDLPPIQACFQLDEYQLKARAAMLQEVVQLEQNFHDLFGVYKQVQAIVHEQGESIQVVAQNVETAQINVEQGNQHLKAALKYQKAAYPLLGAVIGTCVAGPFGLIMGVKTGGLLALGGGVLGYTSGKVLKKDITDDSDTPKNTDEPEIATQATE